MDTREPSSDVRFKPVGGRLLVFDPCTALKEPSKKHPCPDCHFCQFCSEARCHACHGRSNETGRTGGCKLSLREQIKLFDAVNRKCR
jgi:hypothetical protein